MWTQEVILCDNSADSGKVRWPASRCTLTGHNFWAISLWQNMRRLAADYPLLLLCLAAAIFISVAIISASLVLSGIEPSREQLLLASVVGSLLPTITSILALYRVQIAAQTIDAKTEKIDAKIDVVHQKTEQTAVTVDDLANHTREFKSIDEMGPYMHKQFHDLRDNFYALNNHALLTIKMLEEMQEKKHGQGNQ